MAYKIIDVSAHQGKIDWEKVKGNVDGVMIRAGYGANAVDTYFARNIAECNRLGIPCGVYWFSYALNDAMAKREAEYCLAAIKPYKVQLPVAYDFEYDSVRWAGTQGVNISKSMATLFCHEFCGAIEAAGYYAMNYTNKDYLDRYYDSTVLRYDLWLATWKKNADPENPPQSCGMWQYGVTRLNGIAGDVDVNYGYKNYPAIMQKYGLNNIPKTEKKKDDTPKVGDKVKVKVNAPMLDFYEAEYTLKEIKGKRGILYIGDQKIALVELENIVKA